MPGGFFERFESIFFSVANPSHLPGRDAAAKFAGNQAFRRVDQLCISLPKKALRCRACKKAGNEVSVSGAAVFDGETLSLRGYLNDDETSGLNVLKGTAQDGMLEFKLDNDNMAYEIKGSRRQIFADISDPEHIRFKVRVNMEGNVGETQEKLNLMDRAQIA
ncbi:hypothetical protein EHV15_27205 [Paenibacillus oralis]|uniref:Spore germination GerAC-like C-terminal domain-containing protein n=1 Tax=Paenibacillus oralis TaxID=2490856 RepID=A0A3P3UCL0_9BACL|nr:hypothetical protein EHV15_27205 [Paenibacillus oralis]